MTSPMHTSHEEVKEIVNTFVKPLKKELSTTKTWVISFLSVIVMGLFGYGVWVGSIQQRVSNVETNLGNFQERIEAQLIRIEGKIDKL